MIQSRKIINNGSCRETQVLTSKAIITKSSSVSSIMYNSFLTWNRFVEMARDTWLYSGSYDSSSSIYTN